MLLKISELFLLMDKERGGNGGVNIIRLNSPDTPPPYTAAAISKSNRLTALFCARLSEVNNLSILIRSRLMNEISNHFVGSLAQLNLFKS